MENELSMNEQYNIKEFVHSLSIYKTAIEDIHKQEEEKAKELETFTQMKKEHEQENLEVLEYDTNNSSDCVDTREL